MPLDVPVNVLPAAPKVPPDAPDNVSTNVPTDSQTNVPPGIK